MKKYFFKVGAKPVEFITISGLAKLSFKDADTLRAWEDKGWLPPPNWYHPDTKPTGLGGKVRMYSLKYALLMAEEIKKVGKGKPATQEIKTQLYILIKAERNEYSPQ